MVTKTQSEIDEMRMSIENGDLPASAIEDHFAAEERNVFGVGFKRDSAGNPIEQGLGSPSQPTFQSVEAYRIYGKGEEKYAEHLQRMERQLADFQAKRRAAR